MSKKDKPRSKDTNLLSNEPDIGSRLRQIRKNLSLSLQVVAERADVSVGTLSQLERGLSQPSLRTLQNVCTALGIPFAWLFQTSDAELGEGDQVVVRKGEGARLHVPAEGYDKLLLTPQNFDGLQMIHVTLQPHAVSSIGTYNHSGVEAGYVLAGSLNLEVDGKLYMLTAGDSFAFESTLHHRFENRGAVTAEIIWVLTGGSASDDH